MIIVIMIMQTDYSYFFQIALSRYAQWTVIAQHHRCTSWWRFVPHWSWIQLSETNVHFFQQITHFLFRTSMQTMWCRRWLMWLSQVRSVWFRLFVNISCSLQTFKSQLQLKLGLVFHLWDWSFFLVFLAFSLFLLFAVYLFVSVCFFSANFKKFSNRDHLS